MTTDSGTFLVTAASSKLCSATSVAEQLVHCLASVGSLHERVLVAVTRGSSEILKERLKSDNLRNVDVVEVPQGCMGSLATAVFALTSAGIVRGPVHIAAGDTVFHPELKVALSAEWDSRERARTYVFESDDPRFSYVSSNEEDGRLTFVAEKRRITSSATIGLFSFSEFSVFVEAATWCFVNNAQLNKQFYVSTALNYLVQCGEHVAAISIPSNSFTKAWL